MVAGGERSYLHQIDEHSRRIATAEWPGTTAYPNRSALTGARGHRVLGAPSGRVARNRLRRPWTRRPIAGA